MVDAHVLWRGLIHSGEHEEEVPQVHANLHTIGVVLAVVWRVGQLKFWLSLLRRHRHNYSDTAGRRNTGNTRNTRNTMLRKVRGIVTAITLTSATGPEACPTSP